MKNVKISEKTKCLMAILIKEVNDIVNDNRLSKDQMVTTVNKVLNSWVTANKLPINSVECVDDLYVINPKQHKGFFNRKKKDSDI